MTIALPSIVLALDKKSTRREREAFAKARRSENQYGAALRQIARHVKNMVRGFDLEDWKELLVLQTMLEKYSQTLEPWAKSTSRRMLAEVIRRDDRAWRSVAGVMGRALGAEINTAPTGARMAALMGEQVGLITSLPLEAAQRVHKLSIEGIQNGTRASTIAAEILKTGDVTRSRANMIARTEVGRVSTSLTQARAEYIGSEGYTWQTSRDSRVRPSHKAMQGKFVRWDSPPELDGMTGHAGTLPNCRCVAYPQIPAKFFAEAA